MWLVGESFRLFLALQVVAEDILIDLLNVEDFLLLRRRIIRLMDWLLVEVHRGLVLRLIYL